VGSKILPFISNYSIPGFVLTLALGLSACSEVTQIDPAGTALSEAQLYEAQQSGAQISNAQMTSQKASHEESADARPAARTEKTHDVQTDKTALPSRFSQSQLNRMRANSSSTRKMFERAFDRLAKDDVVMVDDLQSFHNRRIAKQRARMTAILLQLDLNGDAKISPTEMLSVNMRQTHNGFYGDPGYGDGPEHLDFTKVDQDGDNHFSLAEIYAFAKQNADRGLRGDISPIAGLNVLDLNDNGEITRQELDAGLDLYIEAELADDDRGSDKVKRRTRSRLDDRAELNPRSKPNKKQTLMRTDRSDRFGPKKDEDALPEACIPSAPEPSDVVVFLSAYEGSGLSSVSVVGMDRATEVSRLNIEAGDRPLYIVAGSFTPTIWSIEGEVSRVRKFVTGPTRAASRMPAGAGVGVTGLPTEKIEFLPVGCLKDFHEAEETTSLVALEKQTQIIDREPDSVLQSYKVLSMTVPTGQNVDKHHRPFEPDEYGLFRFSEEGLVMIDSEAVIAPGPVADYDIYPQEAGIIQLVESGHLETIEQGEFRIVKPITRFPAELTGSHSLKFILADGVPMPGGKPGHSAIYSEESGNCIGPTCR